MRMWKTYSLLVLLAFFFPGLLYPQSEEYEPFTDQEEWEEEMLEEFTIEASLDWDNFDGIHIRLDEVRLHLGTRFVLDGIKYSHANDRHSGFKLDDWRLIFTGQYGPFQWRIEPDLLGVDTPRNLYEAWASWECCPFFRLKAGQFPIALGSEFATREENLPLLGYGFSSYLDGRYDIGLRAEGSLLDNLFWYELTLAAGKGFDLEGFRRSNSQYSIRAVCHPFQWADPKGSSVLPLLRGAFLGLSLAFHPDFDEPIILTSPTESMVFRTIDLDGDDGSWIHWEIGYQYGPLLVGIERAEGSANDVPIGAGQTEDMDQLTSWSAYAAWNITGEEQVWKEGRWAPPLSPDESASWLGSHLPGRWTLAARYSNADIDRDLFDYNYTTYDPSTQEVRTFSLALNWYPWKHTRFALGWVKTIADHELSTFGRTNRDSTILLRLMINF